MNESHSVLLKWTQKEPASDLSAFGGHNTSETFGHFTTEVFWSSHSAV